MGKTYARMEAGYSLKNERSFIRIKLNDEIRIKLKELLNRDGDISTSEVWLDQDLNGHQFYRGGFNMAKFANNSVSSGRYDTYYDNYGSSSDVSSNIAVLRTKKLLDEGSAEIFFPDDVMKVATENLCAKVHLFLTEFSRNVKHINKAWTVEGND